MFDTDMVIARHTVNLQIFACRAREIQGIRSNVPRSADSSLSTQYSFILILLLMPLSFVCILVSLAVTFDDLNHRCHRALRVRLCLERNTMRFV
jgi:hypothetical protein